MSGSDGIDLRQFLTSDGTGIRFGRIAEVGVGTVVGAFFAGVTSIVLGLADIPLSLLSGLSEFLGDVVSVLFGLPAVLIRGSFAEASRFVLASGPAGFLVALGIVLLTLYVAERGVRYVRT